jgi:uncharacterized membrane protein
MTSDHALIQFINENITGAPVLAESYGGSYTINGRVSANTGLQNIFNWHKHQQLWRNSDWELLNERESAINDLYRSNDEHRIREIINRYNVEYIVIGKIERLNYPHMDEYLLRSMGEVIFTDNDLYMIQVR